MNNLQIRVIFPGMMISCQNCQTNGTFIGEIWWFTWFTLDLLDSTEKPLNSTNKDAVEIWAATSLCKPYVICLDSDQESKKKLLLTITWQGPEQASANHFSSILWPEIRKNLWRSTHVYRVGETHDPNRRNSEPLSWANDDVCQGPQLRKNLAAAGARSWCNGGPNWRWCVYRH